MNLARYLTEVKFVLSADNMDPRTLVSIVTWKYGDFLCKKYIQNRLEDQLFNGYSEVETTRSVG